MRLSFFLAFSFLRFSSFVSLSFYSTPADVPLFVVPTFAPSSVSSGETYPSLRLVSVVTPPPTVPSPSRRRRSLVSSLTPAAPRFLPASSLPSTTPPPPRCTLFIFRRVSLPSSLTLSPSHAPSLSLPLRSRPPLLSSASCSSYRLFS